MGNGWVIQEAGDVETHGEWLGHSGSWRCRHMGNGWVVQDAGDVETHGE
jgi:hypothetical protein